MGVSHQSHWFFVLVMLIEPLTSPPTKNWQMLFGAIVAGVYVFLNRFTPGYIYSLETALMAGNWLNWAAAPGFNMVLEFRKKEQVAKETFSFYFTPASKFKFEPGQYLEWTRSHPRPDSRGVRRFFTISSSPTEELVTVTTKVGKSPSSFKKSLMEMKEGDQVVASNPHGDFVLPEDKNAPLAFIAGGIGVTPFRSMIKFMLDRGEERDVTMLYANSTEEDVVFRALFEDARKLGVKTDYVITSRQGYINEQMIREKIPDYRRRMFYVSGPEPMVEGMKKLSVGMGIKRIRTDYFPGYSS